jgi:hypothetical protein
VLAVETVENLTELVTQYNIFCKVWPESVVADGAIRQVGFELELFGSHSAAADHLDPSCATCEQVRAALLAVARSFVPSSVKSVRYEIDTHSGSIICVPALRNCAFVTLSIRILHARGFDQPIDDFEITCLKQIKVRLAGLGIRER